MALILLLETATTSCSVALALDGAIIAVKELNERNIHASSITVFISEVMNQAGRDLKELDAVAVSKGPGSYTGLRIGVSTAKGLCYALNIPLIAVDTLKAMAAGFIALHSTKDNVLYCPMIDARRMEVYTALYDKDLNEVMPVEAKILDAGSFQDLLNEKQIYFFGDGAFKCSDVIDSSSAFVITDFVNSAKDLSLIATEKFRDEVFEDVAYFEPFYLKDFLIQSPKI